MYPLEVVNPSGPNVYRGLLRMPVVRQGVRTGQVTRQGVNDDGGGEFHAKDAKGGGDRRSVSSLLRQHVFRDGAAHRFTYCA